MDTKTLVRQIGRTKCITRTSKKNFKKNELKPWLSKEYCIPEKSSEFVWHMEDVLDLYEGNYDNKNPIICFDEKPYLLTEDKYASIPMKSGQPRKNDYKYLRNGTCNIFMFFEPIRGIRLIETDYRRTKAEFAKCMKDLVDVYYPDAYKIRVVLDNLNTHNPSAFYEMYDPEEARRITRKLEFHYTPKHGSWLNMAEIELSILSKQCINRHIGSIDSLNKEISAWQNDRNSKKMNISWRFYTKDARIKLRQLYPQELS